MNNTHPPVIMYIEDDPEMIDLVKMILSQHGFTVVGAFGGHHALELLAQQTPDLILLDLMMPDLDGWISITNSKRTHPSRISRSSSSPPNPSRLTKCSGCILPRWMIISANHFTPRI